MSQNQERHDYASETNSPVPDGNDVTLAGDAPVAARAIFLIQKMDSRPKKSSFAIGWKAQPESTTSALI